MESAFFPMCSATPNAPAITAAHTIANTTIAATSIDTTNDITIIPAIKHATFAFHDNIIHSCEQRIIFLMVPPRI